MDTTGLCLSRSTPFTIHAYRLCLPQQAKSKRAFLAAGVVLGLLAVCGKPANAQIAKVVDDSTAGISSSTLSRPRESRLNAYSRPTIYMPREASFMGRSRAGFNLDRDGVEKIGPRSGRSSSRGSALVRAVIETESTGIHRPFSRKGAVGLMQLIPTTAQRFGVNDVFNPQQNVDGGVRYLKILPERYDGNLDLALAAYNAGEGAVDRARGSGISRNPRLCTESQNAYFRPGSGRLNGEFSLRRPIRRDLDASGRIIFNND